MTDISNGDHNNGYHALVQAQGHPLLDSQFEFSNFVPGMNTYENNESSSSGNSGNDAQFSFPVRHPSQSDVTGSPSSSYAPSVSDGRNSINYGQPPFKVPGVISQDRRTSSPNILLRNQQILQNAQYPSSQNPLKEMHSSHWTPNFSFGNPTTTTPDLVPQQRYNEMFNQNYSMRQHPYPQHQRRGSQGIGNPQELPTQYSMDRRMSHPILPSHAFDATSVPRPRQQSAVDWRSFTTSANSMRAGQPDLLNGFQGSDGLWNTLDSARGMVAMSHQVDPTTETLKHNNNMRRQSVPFIPDHATIPENSRIDNVNVTGMYPKYSSFSSTEDNIVMQPATGSEGAPDQASMMNTFSAKDNNSGHKKHVCPVCRKRFTRPSSLTTHIYSHTGEKPFICEVDGCGRHFSVISNLRRHKKIHGAAGQDDTEDLSPLPSTATQPN